MSTLLVVKFLHLLGLVYWLGGDLGTYYASRFVGKSELSPDARATAFKIMMGCDQAPRLAMPLMFGTGLHLAAAMGLVPGGAATMLIGWLLTGGWLGMVLALWLGEHAAWSQPLAKIDFAFRLLLLAAILGGSTALLAGAVPTAPYWLSWKLLVFGGMVGMGLMIRRKLKPFVPAWIALQSGRGTPEADATIAGSIRSCKPYVHAIWLGLLVNAALGVHLI
ncbi:MAG: hypothetical protein AAGE01_06330 [Pseudomonadota bacterium]